MEAQKPSPNSPTLPIYQMVAALYLDLPKALKFRTQVMSALTDLQAAASAIASALTALTSEVSAAITILNGIAGGTVNADDPQVAAVAAALQSSVDAATASTTALTTAVTAASAPPVTPTP